MHVKLRRSLPSEDGTGMVAKQPPAAGQRDNIAEQKQTPPFPDSQDGQHQSCQTRGNDRAPEQAPDEESEQYAHRRDDDKQLPNRETKLEISASHTTATPSRARRNILEASSVPPMRLIMISEVANASGKASRAIAAGQSMVRSDPASGLELRRARLHGSRPRIATRPTVQPPARTCALASAEFRIAERTVSPRHSAACHPGQQDVASGPCIVVQSKLRVC